MRTNHFLITRFNIPVSFARNNTGISKHWLIKRFAMFESYCLPTVESQDSRRFFWIILFDLRTSKVWRDRLIACIYKLGNRCILLPTTKLNEQALVDFIRIKSEDSDFVITTRLDNDDAICPNYISMIDAKFKEIPVSDSTNHLLHFPNGCQLHKSGVYAFNYRGIGPFISLRSSIRDLKTVYCRAHAQMGDIASVINLETRIAANEPSMWVQVLHKTNASNHLPKTRRIIKLPSDSLLHFRFKDPAGGIIGRDESKIHLL